MSKIVLKGGKLKKDVFQQMLKASYERDNKPENIDGYVLDRSLSNAIATTYFNSDENKAVVAHRGSASSTDWFNNFVYAVSGKKGFEKTARYTKAREIQDAVEDKYGVGNVITIGHSQGGLVATMVGGNGEVITLNGASRGEKVGNNVTNIKHEDDLVSRLQKKNGNSVTINNDSNKTDIIGNHKINVIDDLDDDFVGKGVKKDSWINFVKSYQKIRGCSYKEALIKCKGRF